MAKISQERADEILDQLDRLSCMLHMAGMINHANTLVGLVDELVDDFERAANNTNPFLEIK